MPENDKQRYSDEDVKKITDAANTMHETIKRIANAWMREWIGDEQAARSDEIMAKIDTENMQNAAGLLLAICTCVDASLIKALTETIGATVAARVKADFKCIEPPGEREAAA